MNPKCIQAVQAAAGRALTKAELKNIEDLINLTMRKMSIADPAAWRAKSADQRVIEGAQQAMADMHAEAALKVERAQLQIIKTAAMETRVGDLMTHYGIGRNKALVREMELTGNYIDGIKNEHLSHMMDLLDAVGSKEGASAGRKGLMLLFDAENPQMSRDLAAEIFNQANGATGNQLAQKGARAWLDSIEQMRQRFNAGGGDVGKLDYGYLPQPHDQGLVRGAGNAAARDKWVYDTLPLLDRSRYLQEDGIHMTDSQLAGVLNSAWETIRTDGLNKMEPGKGGGAGSGARANAGSESRQIHFKDAESYLAYMSQYGGGSMYDAMLGHVGGMARDIGLVERYGPNANQQMRLQLDLAEQADGAVTRTALLTPESYWNTLSGASGSMGNSAIASTLATAAQTTRNLNVAGKLAGATLSSLTDLSTYFVTTGYNKLSYWEAIKNVPKAASKDTKDFLAMQGVIAESMISDLNRWSGDTIKNNWSGRLANSTMKLSLMNAWTDTLRNAFAMTHMNGLAKMAKSDWSKLAEYDRWRMTSKGITEADWSVIRHADLTAYNGQEFLTPQSIRATGAGNVNEVVAKVLGMIKDESEYAVLNPDLAARTLQTWGGKQRGTIDGELARSVMQFKSFPIAMMTRHWRRMLETPKGMDGQPLISNKFAYTGAMAVSLTAMGAVVLQAKEVVKGRDPLDMTTGKFWFRAFLQGGGAGFLGDVLLRDSTSDLSSQQGLFELLGPSAGTAASLYQITKGNIDKATAGKNTHAGAQAVNLTRANMPFLNLWYAKTAFDHMGLHALQENLSPGYLSRMQQRARKDWNQQYWWTPGTGGPDRGPDLSAMGGK
jgi:hypothetical protein